MLSQSKLLGVSEESKKRSMVERLATVLLVCALCSDARAALTPESRAIEDEAVSLLSRYIQIDTTNPPGNEIKAAQFLKQILEREGIDVRIIESAPGRAN